MLGWCGFAYSAQNLSRSALRPGSPSPAEHRPTDEALKVFLDEVRCFGIRARDNASHSSSILLPPSVHCNPCAVKSPCPERSAPLSSQSSRAPGSRSSRSHKPFSGQGRGSLDVIACARGLHTQNNFLCRSPAHENAQAVEEIVLRVGVFFIQGQLLGERARDLWG